LAGTTWGPGRRSSDAGGGAIETLDEELALARARDGDPSAYAVLVTLHAPVARRLAVLSGAEADADDVVQEAFVKAYQALPRFREGSPFRPWLLRIVVNETRNAVRARSRRSLRELRLGPDRAGTPVPDPADEAVSASRRMTLLAAVDDLPDAQREVVTCRYLLELTEAETAEVLDVPAGTVKSRLSRALDTLREVMAGA
jgi:RNA polymerase sigma factor (sigma-70 family)